MSDEDKPKTDPRAEKAAAIRSALGIKDEHSAAADRLTGFQRTLGQSFAEGVLPLVRDLHLANLGNVQDSHALDAKAGVYAERRGFRDHKLGKDLFAPLIRFKIEDSGEVAIERFEPGEFKVEPVDAKTDKVVTIRPDAWHEFARLGTDNGVLEPEGKSLRDVLVDFYLDGLHEAVTS